MRKPWAWRGILIAVFLALVGSASRAWTSQALEPIVYTIKFPAAEKNLAEVEAAVPTGKRDTIDLMMPIWSPGFYRVENYAARVQNLTARTPDGKALEVKQPKKNRWQVQTGGAATVLVSYRLQCTGKSVTGNWVDGNHAILNGSATFITLAEQAKRPHDVRLEPRESWKRSLTGLTDAPDGQPHHYRAADHDTLVDSPIAIGNPAVNEFEVDGSKHYVVGIGDTAKWDGQRAARDLEKIVQETRRMWGFLPFKKYVFIIALRGGGGGLEHANSTLISASAGGKGLSHGLASHEYFHSFNVKRLRPVELGPFDYEKEPRTPSLWIAEGLTTYYGNLVVCRSGLSNPQSYLTQLSGIIQKVQNAPGRLLQSLEQSSMEVWTNSNSGIGASSKTVSYYDKGCVAGFVLDARIRRATNGAKSLDDGMKLAYQRYGGERGYTPEQFVATMEEVAGVDLKDWYKKAIASPGELDYTEALDWYGLQFAKGGEQQKGPAWRLQVREDATGAQKGRLRAWLEPGGK